MNEPIHVIEHEFPAGSKFGLWRKTGGSCWWTGSEWRVAGSLRFRIAWYKTRAAAESKAAELEGT